MASHIRTGDMVIVRSGSGAWRKLPDGKKVRDLTPRKVLKVIRESDRVVVDGVAVRKKAVKPSQANQNGGFIERAMPIHMSNVQPVDDKGQPTRVRFVTEDDGSKHRVSATTGSKIGDPIRKARKK